MTTSLLPAELTRSSSRLFQRRGYLPLPNDQLWYIEQGVVRALSWSEEGETIILGLAGPGDVLGKPLYGTALFQAECLTEVAAYPLSKHQWPQATDALIQSMQRTAELIEILRCRQTEVALLRLLTWLGQRFGQKNQFGWQLDVRLTHQELADMLGATRVTVTRLLSHLEKQGLIQRHCRQILVCHDQDPFWHYDI